jgi:hypothetical protein
VLKWLTALNRDPIGEAGGVNLYGYVNENPLAQTDASGLFALSFNVLPMSTVNHIPGNHWWGWLPFIGGNRIGATDAGLSTRCQCKDCSGSWKPDNCSSILTVKVMKQADLSDDADAFSRRAEAEHIADIKSGIGRIQEAGAAAEANQRLSPFSTQSDCENQSASAVGNAVGAAASSVLVDSYNLRDKRGSHSYLYPWPFK